MLQSQCNDAKCEVAQILPVIDFVTMLDGDRYHQYAVTLTEEGAS